MLRLIGVCICSVLLSSGWAVAGSGSACTLLTRSDVEALFQETVSEGRSRQAMMPAGESCRYSFSKNGGSYGLKIRLSSSAAILAEGINTSAADVFARQLKARRGSSYAAKQLQEFQGLGEKALWNGSDLYVLQGDSLIIISVQPFLEGSFPDAAALKKAKNSKALALAQAAAAVALTRL